MNNDTRNALPGLRPAPTVWDEVNWSTPSILGADRTEDAVSHLVAYTANRKGNTGPAYTGSLFTELSGGGDRQEVAHGFTAEDIVAVSTLSVHISATHALQLMGATQSEAGEARAAIERGEGRLREATSTPIDAVEVGRLLAQLPTDLDLEDATDDDLEIADQLWREIRRRGLGPTRVSKLMARKRPRLCPVIDRDVRRQLGHGKSRTDFFASVREVLRDESLGLADHLHELRDAAVAKAAKSPATGSESVARIRRLTDLRVLDIVLWMEEQEIRRQK